MTSQQLFGCIAGGLSDYCLWFGNPISRMSYNLIIAGCIAVVLGVLAGLFYVYQRYVLSYKLINASNNLANLVHKEVVK